jgi:hypothetical protein
VVGTQKMSVDDEYILLKHKNVACLQTQVVHTANNFPMLKIKGSGWGENLWISAYCTVGTLQTKGGYLQGRKPS